MACELIRTPGGGTAIVCGVRGAKRCSFCDALSIALCDFKVQRGLTIKARELKLGDISVKNGNVIVRRSKSVAGGFLSVSMKLPTGETVHAAIQAEATITVRREQTCDAPCCAQHRVSVGHNVDHCANHGQVQGTLLEFPRSSDAPA